MFKRQGMNSGVLFPGQDGQPIEVDFEFTKDAVIFDAGGVKFKIPKEKYFQLIEPTQVAIRFQNIAEKKDFGTLDSLENFVKISRLMEKGLRLELIAVVMNEDRDRLRAYYAFALQKYGSDQQVKTESNRQADQERDFCLERESRDEWGSREQQKIFLEVPRVKKLIDSFGVRRVADELKVDPKDFELWIEANQKLLDIA